MTRRSKASTLLQKIEAKGRQSELDSEMKKAEISAEADVYNEAAEDIMHPAAKLSREMQDMQEKVSKYEKENSSLFAKNEMLTEKLADYIDKCNKLEWEAQEHKKAVAQHKGTEKSLKAALDKINSLEKTIDDLSTQVIELQFDKEKLNAVVREEQAKNAALQKDIEAASEQAQAPQRKMVQYPSGRRPIQNSGYRSWN